MAEGNAARFFLGANTGEGFTSFFDEFTGGETADRVWYLKGGPGNGKSTFLRRVARAAEEAGHTVEYAMCSGDPDSLDGIGIRELRAVYVDATSPHVQEPALPGAVGRYLDLSAFYRRDVRLDAGAIRTLFSQYRERYRRASSLLRAAAACSGAGVPGILDGGAEGRVRDLAAQTAAAFPGDGPGGRTTRRFLCAVTCRGTVLFPELLRAAGKVTVLRSGAGLEDVYIKELERIFRGRGLSVTLCPDALDPRRTAGLLAPEAGFACHAQFPGTKLRADARLDLDDLIGDDRRAALADELRKSAAAERALIAQAVASLKAAKELHDELEALYRPAVDFAALDRFTARHIEEYIK